MIKIKNIYLCTHAEMVLHNVFDDLCACNNQCSGSVESTFIYTTLDGIPISVTEFLVEHYDNHQPDADWETDQELPFFNPPVVLTVYAKLPDTSFHIEKIKEIIISQKPTVYKEKDFSSSYLSYIFQPPRFC